MEGVGWQQQAPPSGSMTLGAHPNPPLRRVMRGRWEGRAGEGGIHNPVALHLRQWQGETTQKSRCNTDHLSGTSAPVGPSPLHTYQHLWSTYCDPAGVKQGTRILVKHSHCPREPEFHVPFSFILPHNWKHHPDIKMSPIFLPFQKPLKGKAVEEKL